MPRSERYRFHPEAAEEFESAEDWYFSRSVDASAEFLSEVEAGIGGIIKVSTPLAKILVRNPQVCT